MSLSSVLANIDKYVKLPAWLTFVGYMLVAGGLIGQRYHAEFGTAVAYVGLGVSMAGWLYDRIYP